MSNLDVAVSSFWQLARHWKQGDKAKLELSCEGGSLQMQLSAVLGHPDRPHFPHPPPPPPHHAPSPPLAPVKKKSPSQLRRQERRKCEAEAKADKAASVEELIPKDVEKREQTIEETIDLSFKCDQCEYTNATEKGLSQHKRMKHRISQVDGMDDSIEEVAEKAHIGLLEEDSESIKSVSVKYKISVKEKKSVQEVEHDLDRDTWKNIDFSSFDVKEEMGNFSVEVDCVRREYPKDFNVAWAVSLLTSLPWPPGYTVISSLPPSYHRE